MPAFEKIRESWSSFLRELDEKATEKTRLDCMGGFVVTQLYGFSRETDDLDVLMIAPERAAQAPARTRTPGRPASQKAQGLFGLCGSGKSAGGL